MIDILNFVEQRHETPFRNFSLEVGLSKWRFLKKPINWLLKLLGAYKIDYNASFSRITITRAKAWDTLRASVIEFERAFGKKPTHVIVGYDKHEEILMSSGSIHYLQTLNTNELLGMKIVLHPQINGIVPVAI